MSRVLITAGGAGIGRAMANAFAEAEYDVWVTDVDEAALERAPAGWRSSVVDAADETGMAGMFEEIRAEWGGLDVLCANAGIAGPTAAIDEVTLEDWRRCVSVNLEGAFLAAKYATPMMKIARSGAMIFTSSTAGIFGFPNRAPYSSAKWGVIGLMKTVAMELGRYGIRANAICPGPVEGARINRVIEAAAEAKEISAEALRDSYTSASSMRSFVEAEDIANMAVFLGSDGARLVSGQVIAVDGHTENSDPRA